MQCFVALLYLQSSQFHTNVAVSVVVPFLFTTTIITTITTTITFLFFFNRGWILKQEDDRLTAFDPGQPG